jgi:hypothetical protein
MFYTYATNPKFWKRGIFRMLFLKKILLAISSIRIAENKGSCGFSQVFKPEAAADF